MLPVNMGLSEFYKLAALTCMELSKGTGLRWQTVSSEIVLLVDVVFLFSYEYLISLG